MEIVWVKLVLFRPKEWRSGSVIPVTLKLTHGGGIALRGVIIDNYIIGWRMDYSEYSALRLV